MNNVEMFDPDPGTDASTVVWRKPWALGLVIGSFLNVVILRLPHIMEREWQTRVQDNCWAHADDTEATGFG
jgi:hypothetical protein